MWVERDSGTGLWAVRTKPGPVTVALFPNRLNALLVAHGGPVVELLEALWVGLGPEDRRRAEAVLEPFHAKDTVNATPVAVTVAL